MGSPESTPKGMTPQTSPNTPTLENSQFSKDIFYGLKEIIDTERKYIEKLQLLKKYYEIVSIEYKADVEDRILPFPENLKSKDIKLLFGQIPRLLNFQEDLLKNFEPIVSDPTVILKTVSMKKVKLKRVYGDYCINLAQINIIAEEFSKYFAVYTDYFCLI